MNFSANSAWVPPAPPRGFGRPPASGLGRRRVSLAVVLAASVGLGTGFSAFAASATVDFNRDIRRLLSENCFSCHGPDAKAKAGGGKPLRLDLRDDVFAERHGVRALVAGKPGESELFKRITATDPDDKMPPAETGKKLSPEEIDTFRRWIEQGAVYSRHWSYVPPVKSALPAVQSASWPRNAIDPFILARLEQEKLAPSPEADRTTLIRRVALDLTGLPPTLAEIDEFLADATDGAFERAVDRLLRKPAFGEHWARLWLDQARYADSAGYADDPARTIWAYRDYVIRAFNANKPFDQFTTEQLAGDLLPEPTDEQLTATAFHRNTLTNNEGGTNDEEYRNVAVVDRVNTTMAVWMGTTISCAQCHNHKYDPISQDEYFRLFALLNNTADADRTDESPVQALYTPEQKRQKQAWQTEIARLEKTLGTLTPALEKDQAQWEKNFETDIAWQAVRPAGVTSRAGAAAQVGEDGIVQVDRAGKTDVYTVRIPAVMTELSTGFRVEVLPDERPPGRGVGHADGNFVVTGVTLGTAPPDGVAATGRYLRIELPGKEKFLSLAEVQVFRGTNNLALAGEAKQSSTAFEGAARLAIDGNSNGHFQEAKSTTHTEASTDPWWEVDLQALQAVDRVVIWNRTDGVAERLNHFRVSLLDGQREVVWQQMVSAVPNPSVELRPDGVRAIALAGATASYSGKDFPASSVVDNADPKNRGWSIAPRFGEAHTLTVMTKAPAVVESGWNWVLGIEQNSKYDYATIGRLRLYKTSDPRAPELARTPASTLAALRKKAADRTAEEREEIRRHYLSVAPRLAPDRAQLADIRRRNEEIKPYTTVPIVRELAGDQRRKTFLQRRGNYLDLGPEMAPALPVAFHPAPKERSSDRLALAQWLVDPQNPLTSRVAVNRLWENLFGTGLVRTSEEFGSQGELPSHPELLDWLSVELMERKWDLRHMLRLMVTSATYRQSSRVSAELAASDPDNRLLARGPRFRLSAEMIRDQALAVSGLLSPKMYGAPVRPVQPKLGLSAAFGSGTDWEPSAGEDRYRRALYTTWRRSNPYPSMATFDAPNREVCVVRRERSNTPLQALVTLNDPVYLEAAQALARRMMAAGGTPMEKATWGFRLSLGRRPSAEELAGIVALYEKTRTRMATDPAKARTFATQPLGELPAGVDAVDAAAWTIVANTYLNLDELLMKP